MEILSVELRKVSVLLSWFDREADQRCVLGMSHSYQFSSVRGQTSVASVPDREGAMATTEMILYSLLMYVYVHIKYIIASYLRGFVPMCDFFIPQNML